MTEIEELRANGDLPQSADEELCYEYDDLTEELIGLSVASDPTCFSR